MRHGSHSRSLWGTFNEAPMTAKTWDVEDVPCVCLAVAHCVIYYRTSVCGMVLGRVL